MTYFRTHRVIKCNQRLMIQCYETTLVVYVLPDFLRKHIRSRQPLQALAERLNSEWANPIRAIIDFETSVRPCPAS